MCFDCDLNTRQNIRAIATERFENQFAKAKIEENVKCETNLYGSSGEPWDANSWCRPSCSLEIGTCGCGDAPWRGVGLASWTPSAACSKQWPWQNRQEPVTPKWKNWCWRPPCWQRRRSIWPIWPAFSATSKRESTPDWKAAWADGRDLEVVTRSFCRDVILGTNWLELDRGSRPGCPTTPLNSTVNSLMMTDWRCRGPVFRFPIVCAPLPIRLPPLHHRLPLPLRPRRRVRYLLPSIPTPLPQTNPT